MWEAVQRRRANDAETALDVTACALTQRHADLIVCTYIKGHAPRDVEFKIY